MKRLLIGLCFLALTGCATVKEFLAANFSNSAVVGVDCKYAGVKCDWWFFSFVFKLDAGSAEKLRKALGCPAA